MARFTASAVVVLFFAATFIPRKTAAQAFAAAGNGAALAAAGVGFPSPAPVVPCTSTVNIIPWGVPSLIFGQPAGLLTPDNKTYSDVTMCCNGTINFSWTRPHGIFQLPSRSCPATFDHVVNGPQGQQLHAVTPSDNQTLTFNIPGTYYLTSQSGTDCTKGMLFAVTVPANAPNGLCATNAGGPSAFASGTPGGTSTSTSGNAAAAASGPPGTTNTFTGDGVSFSSAGR